MQCEYADYVPWKRTSMYKVDDSSRKLYLASIKGEGIFCVSGIGAFIWKFISGTNSIGFICKEIVEAYDGCTYEQVFADVKMVLDEMHSRDLIIYNWDALA